MAIPTYVAYRFLVGRVDGLARELEEVSLDVLDLLFPAQEETEDLPEDDA